MKRKNWQIYYPILMGIYAVVGLVGANISQMFLSAGIRSIVVTVLFSLVVYALFCWRIKDEQKAALLCAWFMFFFFAYGHIFDALEGLKIFGVVLGRHRFIFPLWLVIFGLGAWWIYTRTRKLESLNRILNIVSIVLLALPVIQIGAFEWQRHHPAAAVVNFPSAATAQSTPSLPRDQLPDIYYIILDGYPRQDMLQTVHNFDNSQFIKQLQSIGFYVPSCSQSNYAMTDLSLTSSLNMNYLEGIDPNIRNIDLPAKIRNSVVRKFLHDQGYNVVSASSGIWFTEWHDANYYLDQSHPAVSSFFDFTKPSEFEVLFIRTTVLRTIEELKTVWLASIFQDPRKEAYNLIRFEFDQLELAPALPGPKFVFVHILAPHTPPFIFAADGSFDVNTALDPYLGNELLFLNQRTIEDVKAIIAHSKNPPIILIQGDHGFDQSVRMANFMAYYFPNGGAKVLYPTITPVNSFRLVFNTYLGQNLPLLPDVSYYSPYDDMYNFNQVRYPCPP